MTKTYTLQEVADLLQMPRRTVREKVFAGEWPHRKISQRRRLLTEGDLNSVLELTGSSVEKQADNSAVPLTDAQRKKNIKAALGCA